jgi:hypothetical protein
MPPVAAITVDRPVAKKGHGCKHQQPLGLLQRMVEPGAKQKGSKRNLALLFGRAQRYRRQRGACRGQRLVDQFGQQLQRRAVVV